MLAIAAQSGWIPYLFFESPGWLLVFFALAFAVTRILGRRTGNKRLIHLSWIAVGLIALLFATSTLVTTKREKLTVALKEMLLAVEDKDFDTVRTLVSDEATIAYTGKEKDRPAFMGVELTRAQMIAILDNVTFDDIILLTSYDELMDDGDTGRTIFRVNARGTLNDFPGVNASEWVVRWRYEDGEWVAIRLECTGMGQDVFFNRPEE